MTRAFKEIKNATDVDLDGKTTELTIELIKLRAQVATGTTPKNAMQIRRSKRTIARILTLKRQRELDALKGKASSKKRGSQKHE